MTFIPGKESEFLALFMSSKDQIRAFQGCTYLELFRAADKPSLFFTYSKWENPACLEAYRNSELFKQTWSKTKILFSEKAEAWSLDSQTNCP